MGISEEGAEGKALGVVTADVVGLGKGTIEGVAVFAVELSGKYTTKTEELAFAAVVAPVEVFEAGLRAGTVVVDTVVDGKLGHHPLATRMIGGGGGTAVTDGEGASDGIANSIKEVSAADERTTYGKRVFTLG